MNFRRAVLSFALLGAVLIALPARAQSVRGSLVGRVTDAVNRPLPAVELTLVDEETNRVRTSKTDANGEFAITALPAGVYRVEADSAGYRKSTRKVTLLVDQEVNL